MGVHAAKQLDAAYGLQSYPANTSEFTATRAWWEAERALSDQSFICPAEYTSEQLSTIGGLDVYQYAFAYSGSPKIPVTLHCSNMNYQFQALPSSASAEEKELADAISSYLYNFAATGNPNAAGTGNARLPTWPKYSPASPTVLSQTVASQGGIQALSKKKGPACAFMQSWAESQIPGAIESH